MTDWVDEVRAASAAAVPALDGEVAVRGLQARVEVLHDRWGVPTCAETLDDLFRAQVSSWRGQLFQLDLLLRLANGRLAGMLGDLGLPSDRFARTVGWNRAGAVVAGGWDEDSHRMVTAYREGALAWLDAMTAPPVEHAVLGLAPWLPEAAASWAAAIVWLSWNLSGNWDEELPGGSPAPAPRRSRPIPRCLDLRFPVAGGERASPDLLEQRRPELRGKARTSGWSRPRAARPARRCSRTTRTWRC
jgi:acyl-homoserine lactone acylase PvdQ